jgi:hydrogenase maturation factor
MKIGRGSLFPVGKLPVKILQDYLKKIPIKDKNVLIGPMVGEDAAAIRIGNQVLLFKTDPITFATDDISHYLIAVNANDIATMGGIPKYMLATMLLPEAATTKKLIDGILAGLIRACKKSGITLVGGHTEITYDLKRPVAIGFLVGICPGGKIIKTSGAKPGDCILISKGIPIEATSLLAREMPHMLDLNKRLLKKAKNLIHNPGISIVKEAKLAIEQGGVTAMHDPTEGGLATGLLELALASQCGLEVYMEKIPVIDLALKILPRFNIDPMGAIASGALIVCCKEKSAKKIIKAWEINNIPGAIIGRITKGPNLVLYEKGRKRKLPRFEQDEIAKVFSRT